MEMAKPVTEEISEATRERDGHTTLACADAFRIAKAHGVAVAEIGRYCNAHKIKMVQCQLGCFE